LQLVLYQDKDDSITEDQIDSNTETIDIVVPYQDVCFGDDTIAIMQLVLSQANVVMNQYDYDGNDTTITTSITYYCTKHKWVKNNNYNNIIFNDGDYCNDKMKKIGEYQ
jgi:hypothetical protein